MAAPMESEAATPPMAAATETAPVYDWMAEVSVAFSARLEAETPLLSLSPSMNARTSIEPRLPEPAPAPLRDAPMPPLDRATEPAKTVAGIAWFERASSVSAPAASTLEL